MRNKCAAFGADTSGEGKGGRDMWGEWSNDACRGYAIKAMEDCNFSEEEIRNVVNSMDELFDLLTVGEAATIYNNRPY